MIAELERGVEVDREWDYWSDLRFAVGLNGGGKTPTGLGGLYRRIDERRLFGCRPV